MSKYSAVSLQALSNKTLESQIKEIWAEVLNIHHADFDSNDNFFLLGGDSLTLSQIKNRLEETFGIRFSLTDLFSLSSVKKMALFFQRQLTNENYPANAGQCGLWYLHQLYPCLYNYCVAFQFKGELDIHKLQLALNQVIQAHGALKSSFYYDWKAKKLMVEEKDFVIEIAQSDIDCSFSSIGHFIEKESQVLLDYQFDLSKGKLLKASLLSFSNEQNSLILCIPHIVTDGWSNQLFLFNFANAYNELNNYVTDKSNTYSSTDSKTYADYCIWQSHFVKTHEYQRQLQYWKNRLLVEQNCTGGHKDSKVSHNSASYTFIIQPDEHSALRVFSAQQQVSLFMTMLCIFKIAFSSINNTKVISVGTPVSNRKHTCWEKALGYFVNILVLQNTIEKTDSFCKTLQKVKLSTLDALQNQDIPFQDLVNCLDKSSSQYPFFDILFSFQNSPVCEASFNGLETELYTQSKATCHYPLNLELKEAKGELQVEFVYAITYYSERDIETLARHFKESMYAAIEPSNHVLTQING